MRVLKVLEKDKRTVYVSRIFDEVVASHPLKLSRIELHVRDYDSTFFDTNRAVVCVSYNNPFVAESDVRGIRTLIRREIFRIALRIDLPKAVGDVIVGREMLKRGYGDDIFYFHYAVMMKSAHPKTVEDYLKLKTPWMIFRGIDDYNADFLKTLSLKLTRKKFPEAGKLLSMLSDLSEKNIDEAVKEYAKLVKA